MRILHRALGRAQRGKGTGYIVAGEPGIGKTTLVLEFLRQAALAGTSGAVVRFLGPASDPVGPLLNAIRGLLPDHAPEARSSGRLGQVIDMLDRLSARVPVVVAMDGLEYTGPVQVALFSELASLAGERHLLVIGTFRGNPLDEGESTHASSLRSLVRRNEAQILNVGPLSEGVAQELADMAAGGALSEASRHWVAYLARGHPLFTVQYARALAAMYRPLPPADWGCWITAFPLPDPVRLTLQELLAGLSPPVREGLSLIGCLGPAFHPEALEVLPLSRERLDAAVHEATRAGLLTARWAGGTLTLSFRYPALAEVLAREAPAHLAWTARRRLMVRAAREGSTLHQAFYLQATGSATAAWRALRPLWGPRTGRGGFSATAFVADHTLRSLRGMRLLRRLRKARLRARRRPPVGRAGPIAAHLHLGAWQCSRGQWALGLKHLWRVARYAPSTHTWRRLASAAGAFLALREWRPDVFTDVKPRHPLAGWEDFLIQGLQAAVRHRYAKARAVLARLLAGDGPRLCPAVDQACRLALAFLAAAEGNFGAAREMLRQEIARASTDPEPSPLAVDALIAQGWLEAERGCPGEARRVATEALEAGMRLGIARAKFGALILLAAAQTRLGKRDEAGAALHAAKAALGQLGPAAGVWDRPLFHLVAFEASLLGAARNPPESHAERFHRLVEAPARILAPRQRSLVRTLDCLLQAQVALRCGDLPAAASWCEAALNPGYSLPKRFKGLRAEAYALYAVTKARAGDAPAARAAWQKARRTAARAQLTGFHLHRTLVLGAEAHEALAALTHESRSKALAARLRSLAEQAGARGAQKAQKASPLGLAIASMMRRAREAPASLGTLTAEATRTGYSPGHLSRALRRLAGFSFRRLRLQGALERAAQLLAETDLTVRDIARACGYHSPDGFSRAFRRCYKLAPMAYRKLKQSP
ncbi:MAG: helix-turn-helix domain-containing protein [Acetobacteraceae bacterium]|nr:helix-turn-helix domain-containing protein [Acetobacteraceae bacterium]